MRRSEDLQIGIPYRGYSSYPDTYDQRNRLRQRQVLDFLNEEDDQQPHNMMGALVTILHR